MDATTVLFARNAEAFPESFNVYDCLGEVHMASGHRDLAVMNYQKSLQLNPDNHNAVTMLARLAQE